MMFSSRAPDTDDYNDRENLPRSYSLDHLGTFQSKSGEKISMILFESDPEDQRGAERGWACHLIEASVGGREAGYMKIVYVPGHQFEKLCPDLKHFVQVHKSSVLKNLDLKDKVSVWHRLNLFQGRGAPIIPPSIELIDRDIERWLAERFGKEYRDFKERIVDRPMVGYIKSEIPRQHIGISMYEVAARWLAERGYSLHSDGPSESATPVWEKMCTDPLYPVKKFIIEDGRIQYELDYRRALA